METTVTTTTEEAPAPAIVIDLSTLTWGELEEVERIAGAESAAALMDGKVRPSAVVPLLWVTRRKHDPTVTIEAIRAMPISTAFEIKGIEVPTPGGAGTPASPPSASSTASDPASS